MQTVSEVEAYRGLASAILLSVITNIIRHRYIDKEFVNSDWCLELCDMAGVVHPLYIRKVRELSDEYHALPWIENSYKF